MKLLLAAYVAAIAVACVAASHAWAAKPPKMTPASTRTFVYRTDPCLANIIERESAGTWDPTIDYGMGHGDTSGPYGLGQANPGTKMARYGADWRTSTATQLRWALAYARATYGSTCAAWSYWQVHRAW